mmetsp:Transcript_32040/g.38812  ORF Transcript_32040/g.38812 Transcript_32040/m.38812 type:complete len:335 (-) Transcript_32040:438-1442(-)|eukprot:CAMPEP_0197855072 /NCGR_PEP_ID=MMETSP1438-20131217/25915_1 /TAXON_ID=1461541 /ORGANISM="Pterosperma sp., Strain CCMP1384" /LENGTH=334 /DNA_ID=CAMNT_0043470049 /DNA_START=195 /DNA_END=1199 /DNA_ORIENTATION=+
MAPKRSASEMSGGVKSKAVIVNAARVDFDNALDLSALAEVADITRFEDSTPTNEQLVERVTGGTEIVVTKEIPVPGLVIEKFPSSVKLICEAGTGFNNIDLQVAASKGIKVCNVPSYSTDAVAQLVITFILNFSCSMVPQQRSLAAGDRRNFTECLHPPHFELSGKTLGLVGGAGSIGGKVGEIARILGMKVLVFSRSAKSCAEYEAVSMEELLSRSDFVSLHCPLTPDTKHLINAQTLKLMKPSAYIVNTARGGIINEPDLIEALDNGLIAGAGLDVQDPEPPLEDSKLYSMEKVILTPHIGWKRLETRQRLVNAVAANVAGFLRGTPINIVA